MKMRNRAKILIAVVATVMLPALLLVGCGSGGGGAKTSQSFEGDGFTLEVANASAFSEDAFYETFIDDTHMKGGSILWPTSTLSGETLKSTIEYDANLLIYLKATGNIADTDGLVSTATLEMDGETKTPQLAWVSADCIVLIFDAPTNPDAKTAFTTESGDTIKLILQ
jgi:hypothetical protein